MNRLKDEGVIYNLVCLCERYITRLGNRSELGSILMRRIEHIYYKVLLVPDSLDLRSAL